MLEIKISVIPEKEELKKLWIFKGKNVYLVETRQKQKNVFDDKNKTKTILTKAKWLQKNVHWNFFFFSVSMGEKTDKQLPTSSVSS